MTLYTIPPHLKNDTPGNIPNKISIDLFLQANEFKGS